MASSANTRFVPVFMDSGAQYLFVRNLGGGEQATAQLVQNAASGERLVRKVNKVGGTLTQLQAGPHMIEAQTLHLLQAEAVNSNTNPKIVEFRGSSTLETQRFSSAGKLYIPVTYLGFCNGGDWSKLADAPLSIVLRMVMQITEALSFMYERGVCHNDLHSENIFVKVAGNQGPDFVLGDFGRAGPKALPEADLTDLLDLIVECQLVRNSLDLELIIDELNVLIAAAKEPGADDTFPDLEEVRFLLEQFSGDSPVTNADRSSVRRSNFPKVKTYTSSAAFRASGIKIQGPYQMATVRVRSNGAIDRLIEVGEEVYHFD